MNETKLKYLPNLDGLRAIAAFAVIVAHFFKVKTLVDFPILSTIAQQGHSGVSLFFVLSGFVITRILLQSVNENNYFKNFYGRRTLRIFPLYYFALICYNYIPYLMNTEPLEPFNKRWYHYLYLQNFARTFNWDFEGPGHFWSLAVEEHFYLIWPALVYLAFTKNKNRLLLVSGVLVVFSFVLRYVMLKDGYEINVFTFTRLDQLALGCILAILEFKGVLIKKNNWIFLSLIFIGFVTVALCGKLDYFNLNLFKHNAYGCLYFGIIAICISNQTKTWYNWFLTSTIVQYLGKVSYGIYVWHILAILFVKTYLVSINLIVDFVIVCIITVIMATISFYLIEKKFLKLKKYFH